MFVLNGCDFIWCCHTCIYVLPNLAFGYCFSHVYVESQEQNSGCHTVFHLNIHASQIPIFFINLLKKNYLIVDRFFVCFCADN